MMLIIEIAVSILPVLAFLGALILLDSFKLIRPRLIATIIGLGGVSAVASFMINSYLTGQFAIEFFYYTRYAAPLIEEFCKALIIIYLLKTNKIGFLVDAAIYGFAVGAGFAVIENIYYLEALENQNIFIWIIRGLGTSVMHGGATSIFTVFTKMLLDRSVKQRFYQYAAGFFIAVLIHSFFNHFILPAVLITLMQLVTLPAALVYIYKRSEYNLREWLEIGFDVDLMLLDEIKSGKFSQTKTGAYLNELRKKFPQFVIVDMFNLLRLHLEISLHGKGDLMMKEAGFQPEVKPEVIETIKELQYLEKSIGKTGWLALTPILQPSALEFWQLYVAKE